MFSPITLSMKSYKFVSSCAYAIATESAPRVEKFLP
jgi:hypothetical protein